MAHLSEITIDFGRASKFALFDGYAWHKYIWKYFPNRESRDFLFRTERVDGGCRLYIVSKDAPDPAAAESGVVLRFKEIPQSFLERDKYLFKIRLNPVRTHVVRDPKTNERVKGGARLTVPTAELPVWINEKFLNAGMRILHDPDMGLEAEISPIGKEFFVKNGKMAFHSSVEVGGAIAVEDREKFKKAFFEGIGHAKAFGFGMLILK